RRPRFRLRTELSQAAEALRALRSPQERPGGVGQRLFESPSSDFEVHLGGGEVGVAEEPLHFGEGGTGVDEEGGVREAEGVGQRAGWGDDVGPAVPAGDEAGHRQQVEGYGGAVEAADEERVGGGVAPRPLDSCVDVAVGPEFTVSRLREVYETAWGARFAPGDLRRQGAQDTPGRGLVSDEPARQPGPSLTGTSSAGPGGERAGPVSSRGRS